MIVCTTACSSLVRKGLSRAESSMVAVQRVAEICNRITISPEVDGSKIEAFVISSKDIQSKSAVKMLDAALERKHPDAYIIFINKDKKPVRYTDKSSGVDEVIINPTAQNVQDAIYRTSAELSSKPQVESSAEKVPVLTPKSASYRSYGEVSIYGEVAEDEVEKATDRVEKEASPVEELHVEEDDAIVPDNKNSIVERMKSVGSIGSMNQLFREISAETVLKTLAKDNAQYGIIETKVTELQREIQSIVLDSHMNEKERLQKVRTVAYDKKFYSLQSNTIIEQSVVDIVDTLVTLCDGILSSRLKEVERSLEKSVQYGEGQMNFGRLAGVNKERANIVFELKTLDLEIKELGVQAVDVLTEISAKMGEESVSLTGSNSLDNLIKLGGSTLIDAQAFDSIIKVLTKSTEVNDFFLSCLDAVDRVVKLHNKLIKADKETIALQTEIMRFMQENNVENTVIANTLLKQALRVFAGPEGCGRSIIPYLLSERKSHENANVLLVDLTGKSKLYRYGIDSMSLDEYMSDRVEKQFLIVTGECDSISKAQLIMSMLTRAADYYRVINIIVDIKDKDILDILCSDIRAINLITDTKFDNMMQVKEYAPDLKYNNVASRLIVNDCSVPVTDIVNLFELNESFDMQVLTIGHVQQLELAALRRFDPCTVDVVIEELREVGKYA